MEFRRSFLVRSTLDEVKEFHEYASSMALLTPPPIKVRFLSAPQSLKEGDEIKFEMWMGFFPIQWHARIENITDSGFQDRMISGPFRLWIHQHSFRQINDQFVEIVDYIKAELHNKFIWKITGLLMWVNLPILFAYRAWKTNQILRKKNTWLV